MFIRSDVEQIQVKHEKLCNVFSLDLYHVARFDSIRSFHVEER